MGISWMNMTEQDGTRMDRILCFVLLLLETRGLYLSISRRKWEILIYYTQLSNLAATASALFLVILGHRPWIAALRYLSTCMLVLTFFVTLFVLIPMGGSPKKLLFSGNGPYHHLLCPVLGTISYIGFEGHCDSRMVLLPVIVTLVYGLIMLALNALRKVDGPYPFFRVHHQPVWMTVLWMVILLLVTAGISQGVHWLAPVRGAQ